LKTILILFALAALSIDCATAQQPTDAVYWCNISRAQVSQERDASLAQIEALKMRNAALEAKIKELESAKSKE
jgi:hypothetical protein